MKVVIMCEQRIIKHEMLKFNVNITLTNISKKNQLFASFFSKVCAVNLTNEYIYIYIFFQFQISNFEH